MSTPNQTGDIFDQYDQQQKTQLTQTALPAASSAPSAGQGDVFDQYEQRQNQASQDAAKAAADQSAKDQVARHGILRRAWDWVNQPLLDHVLPKDIKTSDVIRAAAFEKLYNEAYIPGVNDFETKANEHLGENPTKHGIRTFINGVVGGKESVAETGASLTSPVSLAVTALTAGTGEGLAAASPALKSVVPLVKVARPLVGTAFALKGAHDIYQVENQNPNPMNWSPEQAQQALTGGAMVVGGATAAKETAAEGLAGAKELPSAIRESATNAVEPVKNIVKGGQPRLQSAIREAGESARPEPPAGETPASAPKAPTSIRTAVEDVSNEIKAQSKEVFKRLDKESGGRWQRFEDQIKNLNDKMDEVNGVDDDAYDRLETKRNDIETSQAQMLEDLKAKGVDPAIADKAKADWRQAMALKDLDNAVKGSTSGDVRVGVKETVSPKKFVARVQKLYDSGRLQQAFAGDTEAASGLLKAAYEAKTTQAIRNWGVAVTTLAAAKYAGGRALQHILSAVASTAP